MIIATPADFTDTPAPAQACACCDQCAAPVAAAAVAPTAVLDRSATLGDLATLFGVLSVIMYFATARKG